MRMNSFANDLRHHFEDEDDDPMPTRNERTRGFNEEEFDIDNFRMKSDFGFENFKEN